MDTPQGGLLAFLLKERSRVSESTTFSANARREWNEETLKFLVGLCEEKYWEYNWKPFKKTNWEYFVGKVNEEFPNEPQWTWHQARDKWNKMRSTYQEEKTKQVQIGILPSSWTPWYEIFDNIFAGTTKTNGVSHGIDQSVYLQYSEVNILSDDDDIVPSTPPPLSTLAGGTSSQTPHTKSTNQHGCEG